MPAGHTPRRRLHRKLLLGGAVLALELIAFGLAAPPRAAAHAELVSSDPPAGAVLRSRSTPIFLRFSEGVDPARSAVVIIAGSSDYAADRLTPVGNDATRLAATVPRAVPDGSVTIDWTTTSADDGHVATGRYRIGIGAGAAAPATAAAGSQALAAPSTAGVSGLFTVVRIASYVAMALFVGGLVFLTLVWPDGADVRRSRVILWVAWATGLVATALGIGLEGAYSAQRSLATMFDTSQLAHTLGTNWGIVWGTRFLLYLLATPVLLQLARDGKRAMRSLPWLLGASAMSIGILRTPGLVSHSIEGSWAWLGSIADLAHVVGITTWIGGLAFLALVVLPFRTGPDLEAIVRRFSTLAMVSVGGAVIAGTFMSWQLVGSVQGLTGTHYGRVLMVKLALVVAALVVADQSRRWVGRLRLQPVDVQETAVSAGALVVAVATEIGLGLGVLCVAAVLVNTSPGR